MPPSRQAVGSTKTSCDDCGPQPGVGPDNECWSCVHEEGAGKILFEAYLCEGTGGYKYQCQNFPCTGPMPDCPEPSPPPSPGPSPDPDPPSPGPSPDPDPASSGGTWAVSVWYKVVGTPDCTSDPDATVTFTTAACNCLIEDGSDCFASATLDVSSGDTITADVYVGGGCAGEALGGDTELACDTCTAQTILTGGVALHLPV